MQVQCTCVTRLSCRRASAGEREYEVYEVEEEGAAVMEIVDVTISEDKKW